MEGTSVARVFWFMSVTPAEQRRTAAVSKLRGAGRHKKSSWRHTTAIRSLCSNGSDDARDDVTIDERVFTTSYAQQLSACSAWRRPRFAYLAQAERQMRGEVKKSRWIRTATSVLRASGERCPASAAECNTRR